MGNIDNNKDKRHNLLMYKETSSWTPEQAKELETRVRKGDYIFRNVNGKVTILKARQTHTVSSWEMMCKKIMKLWKK